MKPGLVQTARHRTAYHELGAADAPVVVLVHGWPLLGASWQHQLDGLAEAGWRVIAPDLRGCGGSAVHAGVEAYAQREIVRDLIELIDGLGIERAVWLGHDWGAIVVSNLVRHHAERCLAAGGLSQPFNTLELGAAALVPLLNRQTYPEERSPFGQFEYMRFYQEHFAEACQAFDRDPERMFKAVMRQGDPAGAGQPFLTAFVRENGGWFGPHGQAAPDMPLDQAVLSPSELAILADTYRRSGFRGVNALYMNDARNASFFREASPDLDLPVLFLSGTSDFVCYTEHSALADPMRHHCSQLTYHTVEAGHWLPLEARDIATDLMARWLNSTVRSRIGA